MRLAILQKLNPPEIGKDPNNVLVFFKIWPFLFMFFLFRIYFLLFHLHGSVWLDQKRPADV